MAFPKRLLGEGESVVLLLHPHVKRLLGPVLVLLFLAPAASFLAARVPDGSVQGWARLVIVVLALLVAVRWVLWPFLVWWNTLYVVTDRRLVMRQGVLGRSGHDMPLTRLNDVSFSHNLLERVLGCGTLVVESAGEAGQVVLTDVPRVEQVQRTLYRLSDCARAGAVAPPAWMAHLGLGDLDDENRDDDDRHDDEADDPGGHQRWGRDR